jgi:hypothetical protein
MTALTILAGQAFGLDMSVGKNPITNVAGRAVSVVVNLQPLPFGEGCSGLILSRQEINIRHNRKKKTQSKNRKVFQYRPFLLHVSSITNHAPNSVTAGSASRVLCGFPVTIPFTLK